MKKYNKRISVFGGREITEDIYEEAVKLGRAMARANFLVYCGGGNGVMEAIAKGVSSGEGTCVGILKGKTVEEANPYISIPVSTGFGVGRNVMLAYNCDIAVAVSGSYGTLSEISYALSLEKPVIGLKSWDIPGVIPAANHKEVMEMISEYSEK